MRCAHCKSRDVDVAHVRACSGVRFDDDGIKPVTDGPMWPASDAQIKYVLGLQEERLLPEHWMPYDEATLRKLEKDEVSGLITMLKSFSIKEKSAPRRWDDVPEGRFAIQGDYIDGVWQFFEVTKPTTGRWSGYTFIKMLVGAPGAYKKVQMQQGTRDRILAAIARDPKAAMLNYGLQSGVCGRCSSPLTDPESLAAGIGPVCAKKSGWF